MGSRPLPTSWQGGAVTPVEISAGRLHLRPWAPHDAAAVLELFTDPLTVRWTPAPVPFTIVEAAHRVEQAWPAMWEAGTGAPFAVLDSTTAEVLGWVAVFGVADRAGEIGWA